MRPITTFVFGLFFVSFAVATPPNVVIIFMDDMGYADINPLGASEYETPNLNRMAKQGRLFTDFVASSAVCSASRIALLTGCYHQRVGISGALGPKARIGIHADETTIAEVCKSKGYATAIFGKWHLGHHPRFLPHNHGFDQYYGLPYSNDMWPLHPRSIAKRKTDPDAPIPWSALPMLHATIADGVTIANRDVQPKDQEKMTREFTERAVDFIKSNAETPFFLYLPHPMVHVPLYAGDEFRGKSGKGIFADVMMEIDWSVGQVLDAIHAIGADENTLVVFTSDNGPWLSYGTHAGSAGRLREGKGTMFEGGYREPTIMRWKGKIPAGSKTDMLCSTIDLLPTVAHLIGAELPEQKIDGKDIRPVMFGAAGPKAPHDSFWCYYSGGQLQAVRDDRFKLVFPHKYRTLSGRKGGDGGRPADYEMADADLSLYDLDNDISETNNVIDQYPDVVAQLEKSAEQARHELGDRLQKRKGTENRLPGKLEPGDEELPLLWN
jgi:arylsulfatase A